MNNSGSNITIPPWATAAVNVLIALVFLLIYLGSLLAAMGFALTNRDMPSGQNVVFPTWFSNDVIKTVFTVVGGTVSGLFAVALNLKTSPVPRTPGQLLERAVNLMMFFVPEQEPSFDVPSANT